MWNEHDTWLNMYTDRLEIMWSKCYVSTKYVITQTVTGVRIIEYLVCFLKRWWLNGLSVQWIVDNWMADCIDIYIYIWWTTFQWVTWTYIHENHSFVRYWPSPLNQGTYNSSNQVWNIQPEGPVTSMDLGIHSFGIYITIHKHWSLIHEWFDQDRNSTQLRHVTIMKRVEESGDRVLV